jgi:hypothetical protein
MTADIETDMTADIETDMKADTKAVRAARAVIPLS